MLKDIVVFLLLAVGIPLLVYRAIKASASIIWGDGILEDEPANTGPLPENSAFHPENLPKKPEDRIG